MVVARDASNHEELFELLGSLGEGVKFAGVEAGGDEEVTGAFGGRVGEDGGGYLSKIMFVHVGAEDFVIFGSTFQNVLDRGTTEIEETIFEAEFFARDDTFVVGGDGEGLGAVEKFNCFDD